jgi:glutathione peroxidase
MLRKTGSFSLVFIGFLVVVAWGCTDIKGSTSNAGSSGVAGANPTSTGGSDGNAGSASGSGGSSGTGGVAGDAVVATGGTEDDSGSGGTGGVAEDAAVTAGSSGAVGGDSGETGGTAGGEDGSAQQAVCEGAYQFSEIAEGAGSKSLCDYKGDVLLIVNIAANCAFTPQLAGIVQLQTSYNNQGFNVLGFWNNQFLSQMGDPTRREAVKTQYGVNFPLFEEINVNAPDEDPLFTWLKSEAGGGNVGWNFEKFLIGRDGSVIKRYLTQVTPESIATDVEAALK